MKAKRTITQTASTGRSKKPADCKVCTVEGCGRPRAWVQRKNAASSLRSVCWRHHEERRRNQDPALFDFRHLRKSARRRGLEFTLTLEQFREFCRATGFDAPRKPGPRTGDSLSIDRIDPSRGYVPGNIQVLTLAENAAKGVEDRKSGKTRCYVQGRRIEPKGWADPDKGDMF